MAVPEGFQSATTPRDTFVQQSTVAAINITDPLSQVATALATIEPKLQKFIVTKIEDIKEKEVAEAQQKGSAAGRIYSKTEKLLYPQNVEIDETSEDYAKSLNALKKNQKGIDVEITRGKSLWYSNAYQEAKAITLGKNFAVELESNYDTYRVPDKVTGEMKPLSAYPYQSAEVQDYISSFRNKNVEAANVSEFYFNRSFLPQIEKGVKNFAKEHDTDHAYYKLEEYKKQLKENLGLTWTSYQIKTAKFGDKADFSAEAKDIREIVENVSKIYQAEDQAKIYDEVIIPWIMDRGLLMASMTEMGDERFDLARDFIKNYANLFPRKMKTETKINKKGEVVVNPVLKRVVNAKGEKMFDEKGKPLFEAEYFDQNVLQTKKNYESKLNTALKAINALEIQDQKIGGDKDLLKDRQTIKTLLRKGKDITDEDRQTIKELASKSPKALTWLKNNRDTYNPNPLASYNQLYADLRGGNLRDDELAYVKIEDWYNSTLKLDADTAKFNKLNDMVDTEANEERVYAATGAKEVVTSKTIIFNTLSDETKNDPVLMSKLNTEVQAIIPYMMDYAETKKVFTEGEAPRYPTKEEIDAEKERRREVMNINLLAIQKYASDQDGINMSIDSLTPEFKQQEKDINKQKIKEVLKNLISKQDIVGDKRAKPKLEDLEMAYDYLGKDVTIEFLLNQFSGETEKAKTGDIAANDKENLAKLLNEVELSDQDIEQYGILDLYENIGDNITRKYSDLTERINNYNSTLARREFNQSVERGDTYPEGSFNADSKFDDNFNAGNTGVVTPQNTNENVEESNVLTETPTKTVDTNKGGNEVKTINNVNLSKIFSDIIVPPANAVEDGTLLTNTGEVPLPIGAGDNFMKRFDLYLKTAYGFDTNDTIYKAMPNYMKSNLMGSFQDETAQELGTQEETPTVTGDFLPTQDLSKVQSDMTSNLGLRDGSLIAMALPPKGTETKEQQDTKVEISKDQNNVVRMETNFKTIYALAKEVGIKFPEVVAAQFGVESTHGLKVTGTNNYLGIKARPEDIKSGNFTEVETFEEINGKMVKRMEKFKNFTSVKEMLLDYKKHHNDDWFNGYSTRKGTINVNTAEEAIIRLKENGYATDSDYVKLVTDVLNDARRNPPLY